MSDHHNNQESPENLAKPGRQPMFLLPGVIAGLAGVMLAIQAASSFVLNQEGLNNLIGWFAFFPARFEAPNQFPGGMLSLIWTPVTYAFLHAGWEHVIGNTVWMVIFGTPVARRYGTLPTLIIFAISSIVGALAFAVSSWGSMAVLVGASGGIAGLTGAAMRFIFEPVIVAQHPQTGQTVVLGKQMASIRGMFRNPTTRNFTLFWIIANCLVPFVPLLIGQQIEIAWQAHLGGFFTGLLLAPFFERPRPGVPVEADGLSGPPQA